MNDYLVNYYENEIVLMNTRLLNLQSLNKQICTKINQLP